MGASKEPELFGESRSKSQDSEYVFCRKETVNPGCGPVETAGSSPPFSKRTGPRGAAPPSGLFRSWFHPGPHPKILETLFHPSSLG